jgi:cytochrome c551/c552
VNLVTRSMRVGLCAIALLLSLLPLNLPGQIPTLTEKEADAFFVESVKPILQKHCWSCHADDPEDIGGELALTSRDAMIKGGESGPAVNLQDHLASLLVKAINYDVLEMPPDEKLSKEDIATLTKWVALGIPWPAAEERAAPATHEKKEIVTEEAKRWWAFQIPQRPTLPTVKNADWCRNDIDRFILKQLEDKAFSPAREASKETLIRRAYYDLVGLPPTPEEVEKFVNSTDPQAYEKLVDQLLASPHYGEKWARHWLDLVRYAESNSFERDGTKPFVWRYRDYVIQSLNADKPYDKFLVEQLAGDELPNADADAIIATGYYRLGQWDDEPADPEQARFDSQDDILATTSQTMLGLTVNCARCHDHKIDPITAKDYYQMLSFFRNIRHYGIRGHDTVLDASTVTIDKAEFAEANIELNKEIDSLSKKIGAIEEKGKKDFIPVEHEEFRNPERRLDLMKKRVGTLLTQGEFDEYQSLRKAIRETRRKLEDQKLQILCVKEQGPKAPQSHVMIRGNAHVTGEAVEPGFLSVLSPPQPEIESLDKSSGRRLALAKWIASPQNPMTARVMANRVWQYHFGRGIVRTSSDFGFQGSKPTHPELLDWLATEFVNNGWRLKPLHRQMMLSSAYRMSSEFNEAYADKDPENDLFWRFNMRRLQAEEIRDSILFVNAQLNHKKMFGRSMYPDLPKEVLAGQSIPGDNWERSSPEDQNRRSIYIHVKRSLRVPILSNYDAPDPDFTCPVRFTTTQPTQALGMINSDFMHQQAAFFAASLGDLDNRELADIVRQSLLRVIQREPKPAAVEQGVALIESWINDEKLTRADAVKNYCLLCLNLNEFVYLD